MGQKEAQWWLAASKAQVGVISNYGNGGGQSSNHRRLARADLWGWRVNHHVPRSEIDGKPAAVLTVQAESLWGG